MKKSMLAITVVSGLLATPVFAQIGGGLTGGAGVGGAVGGAGAGVGTGVDTDVGGKAGVGTKSGADVGVGTDVKAGIETDAKAGTSARMGGVSAGVAPSMGLIGRTVVGADGTVIGTVKGVNTKADLSGVSEVFVKTAAGAKTVTLVPAQLTGNAAGHIVASGVSKADIGALPAAAASHEAGLIGKTVYSADGKALGTVSNLVVEDKTGALSQVVLDTGKSGNAKLVAVERAQIASDAKGKLSAPKLTAAEFKAITTAQAAGAE